MTNQTNNLFSSNLNGALHTQSNLNTINNTAIGSQLLENGSNSSNLKPSSELLGILANNSQSFHSNIFSQNHSFTSLNNLNNPYLNNQNNQFLTASSSSLNPTLVNQFNPNSNSMQTQLGQPNQTLMNTNTLPNYQTKQNILNVNANGNNLLMNPAFTATTANMNPFASGFAQPTASASNAGGNSATSFEPNFAGKFSKI